MFVTRVQEIANSYVDQQQGTKERGDEKAREERKLEKRKAEAASIEKCHNWHPALLSPYTCKLSLTSHTLDEGKFVQRYSGKA